MTDRARILETYDLVRAAVAHPKPSTRRSDLAIDMSALAPYIEDGTLVELVRLARERAPSND